MLWVSHIDGVLGKVSIEAGVAPLLRRPLGHGLVVGAQVVAMGVVVAPIANGFVVEGIDEDGLEFSERGWVLDGSSFGMVAVRVEVRSTMQRIPIPLAGVGQSS